MSGEPLRFDVLGEIEVAVTVRLGAATLPLAEAARIAIGSVVRLACAPDAPVDVLVNGVAIARGDLVLADDDSLAVEIREVVR